MQIKVYTDIKQMQGQGEEWLVDSIDAEGNFDIVRAVFIDGHQRCNVLYLPQGNNDITKVLA